uniref:Uncharacterized protein n=1 Tax=Brassica campestris TaxID=3711 RepID=M4F0K3_BRACM
MCDIVVGALSRIHLDLLRGGLDPRLVTLDWSISEAVGVWGDSESAFWCSDPDLSFAFVDLWCERRLRRVLLRRSGSGASRVVFRSVSCFVVEWGSKLSQDGDLASRFCQRLCLVVKGDDGGSAMSTRARWILWLCGRCISVVCACNRSLEVQDLSSMAALFSLSGIALSLFRRRHLQVRVARVFVSGAFSIALFAVLRLYGVVVTAQCAGRSPLSAGADIHGLCLPLSQPFWPVSFWVRGPLDLPCAVVGLEFLMSDRVVSALEVARELFLVEPDHKEQIIGEAKITGSVFLFN